MNKPMNDYLSTLANTMKDYMNNKMDEKEKEGLIINREIVEEITQELVEGFENYGKI